MHYVRDDLDDIDENDIGEKKRFAFLQLSWICFYWRFQEIMRN